MVDYVAAQALALRLIKANGRLVALQKPATGLADAAERLGAPAPAPDPVAGVPAAFVPLSAGLGMGVRDNALFKNSTAFCLMPVVAGADPRECLWLIDTDNSKWKINAVETFKPGDTELFHFIGMERNK